MSRVLHVLRGLVLIGVVCAVSLPGVAQAVPPTQGDANQPMLALNADAVVWEWPNTQTRMLGVIPARSLVPTNGRTVDQQWWRIPYPSGPDGNGWVTANVGQPNAAAANVPRLEIIFATPTPQPIPPTPTPLPCAYNAAYVADMSIPDHTQIQPGQAFSKIWRISNSGSCPWEEGTSLVFTRGFKLSAPDAVPVPPTAPGGAADIGVQMVAPTDPGSYTGAWQLRNALGQFFGSGVTVVIDVPGAGPAPTPPPPAPPQPSAPSINFWADTDRVTGGQCTNIHWDVRNVRAIYLEYGGHTRGVTGQETKWVCPASDGKRYILHVELPDGSRQDRELKINTSEEPHRDKHVNVSVDPGKVPPGYCTSVSWDVGDMHKIKFDGHEFHDRRGSYNWCVNEDKKKTFTVCWDSSCKDRTERELKVKILLLK